MDFSYRKAPPHTFSKARTIIATNLDTGEDEIFFSMTEASKALEINVGSISACCRNKKQRAISKCNFDEYKFELSNPVEVPEIQHSKKPRPVRAQNYITGEITEYPSMSKASKALGVNSGFIRDACVKSTGKEIIWTTDSENCIELYMFCYKEIRNDNERDTFARLPKNEQSTDTTDTTDTTDISTDILI